MSPDGGAGRPPRLPEALLSIFLPAGPVRESVLGDLHELYAARARPERLGVAGARRWYWRQAVGLSARHVLASMRGRRTTIRGASPLPPGGSPRDAARSAETLLWQLRLAVRSLLRSPRFTAPALIILAVGLTSATTMFTLVDAIALRPLDYPESERLVLLCEHHETLSSTCVASPGNAVDLTRAAHSLEAAGFARGWALSVQEDGGTEGVRGGLATAGFFRALGVTPEQGRLFTDEEVGPDADDVAVLSHAHWTARYGADPEVIGRTVRIDGAPTVVVGVLPAAFEAPLDLEGVELWKPPHVDPEDPDVRGWRGWRVVARMSDGVERETALRELEGSYAELARIHDEIDAEWSVRLVPLREAVLGETRIVLYALLGAAGLLMIVVCANVANLLLARGAGQREELAVRTALGASRGRLVTGLLLESTLISATAGAAAVLLTGAAVRVLLAIAPPDIPRLETVAFDGRALAFAVAVALVATALFGLLPALRITAEDLAHSVRSGIGRGEGRSATRLRNALVAAELAVSVVLVVAAGLLTRSFAGYLAWEPGFDREGLVAISLFVPPEKYETATDLVPLYRAAEEAVGAVGRVSAVATASAGPLFGGGDGAVPVQPDGWNEDSALPSAQWFDVGPRYFETLGLSLREGREILESDARGSRPVVVVNEALARAAWGEADPLGRTLTLPDRGGQALEVVGVVADVPSLVPGRAPEPQMYWSNRQQGRWGTYVLVRASGDATTVGADVVRALAALDPDLSLGTPWPLTALEARALIRPRFQASVLLAFALIALVLAVGGVYAVVAFSVERRAREVGIRLALGAAGSDVVAMIVRTSLVPALGGIAIGLGGAALVGSLLRSSLYGVSPLDPISLGAAALLLVIASALAAAAPALRAARVDPLAAIGQE
jgi:putative ABC transport system permease protein